MVGFDDAAMMGLGVLNTGIQMFGQRAQARQQKKLGRIEHEAASRNYKNDLLNLRLQGAEVNRDASDAQSGTREDMGDRGMLDSSERNYQSSRLEDERLRRQEALARQTSMMNADWLDYNRKLDIQKKMAKTQQTMSMISGMLMQGGSGAAGMMGG